MKSIDNGETTTTVAATAVEETKSAANLKRSINESENEDASLNSKKLKIIEQKPCLKNLSLFLIENWRWIDSLA